MEPDAPSKTLASGLSKDETRTTLASLNMNIWLRSVCDNICGGTTFVFVSFALALGVQKDNMGFFTSMLSLACILQIVGLVFSGNVIDKRRFVVILSYAEPIVLILTLLLVPFLPQVLRLPVLVIAMFSAAGLLHITKPLTEEWTASSVPDGLRGRYLGKRLQALTLVNIATILLAGVVASRIAKDNAWGFGLIMVTGAIFGLLAVLPLRKVSLPRLSAESRVEPAELKKVLAYKPFLRYLFAIQGFILPFSLLIPYYHVVHLEVMHMDKALIAVMQASYFVCKIGVAGFAGKLTDRFGPRTILFIIGPMYALFFATYAFVGPDRYWPVWAGWAFIGLADGLYFVAYTSSLYGSIPQDRTRSAYFAVFNLASLGQMALGASLAVFVVKAMAPIAITIGSYHIGQYQAFYLLGAAAMLLCTGFTFLIPKRPRRPTTALPE